MGPHPPTALWVAIAALALWLAVPGLTPTAGGLWVERASPPATAPAALRPRPAQPLLRPSSQPPRGGPPPPRPAGRPAPHFSRHPYLEGSGGWPALAAGTSVVLATVGILRWRRPRPPVLSPLLAPWTPPAETRGAAGCHLPPKRPFILPGDSRHDVQWMGPEMGTTCKDTMEAVIHPAPDRQQHGTPPTSTDGWADVQWRLGAGVRPPLPCHLRFVVAYAGKGRVRIGLAAHEDRPRGDEPPEGAPPQMTLSWAALRPFLKVAVPFFREEPMARRTLFFVAILTLLNSAVIVTFTYIQKGFWTALSLRDAPQFYRMIAKFSGALLCGIPISVLYVYQRERLSLYWREKLTARILQKYYAQNTFYALETLRDIDNPDQRIAEDVRTFTRTSLEFFITAFTAAVDLCSFSTILFRIYPGLFVAIVLYSGLGTLITSWIGRSLVRLNYLRLLREADFRYALIRTRENAEAIAFYDQEASLERGELWRRFQLVVRNTLRILRAQRNLEVFTTGYRYIVQIIPGLVIAPLYFAGQVELGVISQAYSAFNHILTDFSLVIGQFEALSAFNAGLTRLTTFIDRIEGGGWPERVFRLPASDGDKSDGEAATSRITLAHDLPVGSSVVMALEGLSVRTPDGVRLLVQDLSLELHEGDKILLVGNSGTGKSSVVRAMAGLWPTGSGAVHLQPGRRLFFLPQKPYNVLGSLRQQIMYPTLHGVADQQVQVSPTDTTATVPPPPAPALCSGLEHEGEGEAAEPGGGPLDVHLLGLLERCQLGSLAARVGGGDARRGLAAVRDWSRELSLGEQQRLAFARVLFNRPSVVVLDEATSALDLAAERAMYEALGPTTTYVSIGHRPSLLGYHTKRLILRPQPDRPGAGCTGEVVPIAEGSRQGAASTVVDLTAPTDLYPAAA